MCGGNTGNSVRHLRGYVEGVVSGILKDLLSDSENLMSLAVDAARYYEEKYNIAYR